MSEKGISKFQNNLLFVFVFLIFISKLFLIVYNFNFVITDNDQAIFWLACHDFSEGKWLTPFIYGCSYGSMLESILAIPFYRHGMPLYYALPLSNFTWFTLLILLTSIQVDRLFVRYPAGSIFLFSLALLPSEYFAILFAAKGHLAGILMALFSFNLLMVSRYKFLLIFVGIGYGLSMSLNPNSFFLILFSLLLIKDRIQVHFLIIGGFLSLIYYFYSQSFLNLIDTGFLHHQWDIEFNFSDFFKSLSRIDQYLNTVTPFFHKTGFISLIVPCLLALIYLKRKEKKNAYILFAFSFLLLLSFGINKVFDGHNDILFPYARFYLSIAICNALFTVYIVCLIEPRKQWQLLKYIIPVGMLINLWFTNQTSREIADSCGNTYAVKKSYVKDLIENVNTIHNIVDSVKANHKLILACDYPLYSELIFLNTLHLKDVKIMYHHKMFYWIPEQILQNETYDLLMCIQYNGLLESEKMIFYSEYKTDGKIPFYFIKDLSFPNVVLSDVFD